MKYICVYKELDIYVLMHTYTDYIDMRMHTF